MLSHSCGPISITRRLSHSQKLNSQVSLVQFCLFLYANLISQFAFSWYDSLETSSSFRNNMEPLLTSLEAVCYVQMKQIESNWSLLVLVRINFPHFNYTTQNLTSRMKVNNTYITTNSSKPKHYVLNLIFHNFLHNTEVFF